ncbi:MAG: putative extracytoplasmic binding receptor [Pseudomonadota bacterium]
MRILSVLIGACLLALSGVSSAQTAPWPSRPITLLVGNAPGGSNDVFARAIAKRLQEVLGQPVVVENRPAGGGVIANTFVSKAPADGYAFVVVSSTFTTGAASRRNLAYDAVTGFTPIAYLGRGPLLVTVPATSPYRSLGDLLAAAKASPGKLNYASSGYGSINQFATELLAASAGISLTHVPYKGIAPAAADLISGQVEILVASAPSILNQVKAGRVRALAVTSASRSPVAPDLPSLEESGLKESASELWWGILGPPGLADGVVQRMNTEINRILQSAEMREFFLREGAEPATLSPAEFKALVANEVARWRSVAQKAGIVAE